MNDRTFTVKIEDTHDCGQVFETIAHMAKDDLFAFKLSSGTMPPFKMPTKDEPYKPFDVKDFKPVKAKLELVGYYDKVEISGIMIRDKRLVCVKCGRDVLFPEQ